MKKIIVLGLTIMMSTLSFAQKKELKEAEKEIKSNNYASAKAALSQAEPMLSAMDDKLKAKYYYLKAQAYYANGSANDQDIATAVESFDMLSKTEKESGRNDYGTDAAALKMAMSNSFLDKAQNALNRKDHTVSAVNFERAYRTSKADTLYLYNAAVLHTSSKGYDDALRLYAELMDLGYTGISMEYKATDIETGEEQSFPNKAMRDISVKAGTHEKSRNVKSESKVGEMAKNVALIYIEQGKSEEALKAIEEAKASNPNDLNLILAEANVRYQLGDKETYKSLISQALELEPNNADLLFNLGVVAADSEQYDEAKTYYDKAIQIDPTYVRAYMNMAAMILDREQGLIDAMNKLGTSSADNKKYDELQEDRMNLYRDATPYLTAALKNDPDNINAAKTLMNIYSVLGDTDNFKMMKAKVETMEGNN